jgi:hypothetical protein
MKRRTPLCFGAGFLTRKLSFAVFIAGFIVVSGHALGKTASCPCSPCKCSPCTCGGGGKGDKHHHDRERGSVGVGVNVDLGGVGQRKAEPNPFAATNPPPSSRTQEKPRTKKTDRSIDTTFDKVELTTAKAKDQEKPNPFAQVELTGEKGKGESTPMPVGQTTKP